MIKLISKLRNDKDFFEIFQKGGISFLIRIGGQIMGFLLSFIIAHYYGAQGLGSFVLAITVLRIFTLLAKLGLDTTSVRFIASFAKQNKWKNISLFRRKTLVLLCITSVISSLIMYILSQNISLILNIKLQYLQMASYFVLPMTFFVLHYQSLKGLKKIAEFSFFYRMSQATFTIISIYIISIFISDEIVPIYAYLSALLIVSVLSFISYKYWFIKSKKVNHEEIIENLKIKDILKISIPLMFAQSVQFIMAWTDKLMIGNMLDPESVAVYGVAFRFSMIVSITLMAVNSIAAPKFAEKFAMNDTNSMAKIAIQSSKLIFWTTLPFAAILLIFPKFFMALYGTEFLVGFEVLRLLIIGRLINAFSGSVGNLMQMSGQQNSYMSILIIGAIINIGLNLLLIPKYGIDGAAYASIVSMSFWNLSMVYMVKKKFGFFTMYIPFINKKL